VSSPLDNYLAATFPDTRLVLGTRLHAFTLGHALLQPAELADLILFVELCRVPFAAALRRSRSRWFGVWLWQQGLKWRRLSWSEEALIRQTLDRYLAEANSAPMTWSEMGRHGRKSGAPMLQSLKVTLMSRLHKSEAEALATPLVLATWDYFAYWEQEGAIKITNDTDAGLLEMTRKLELEIAEGKIAGDQPRESTEIPQATNSNPSGGNAYPATATEANSTTAQAETGADNRLDGR
jgi:hypothetical protein